MRWIRRSLNEAESALRYGSLLAVHSAAEAGLGFALLYRRSLTYLLRFSEPLLEMTTVLWVLTHEDLRRIANAEAQVPAGRDPGSLTKSESRGYRRCYSHFFQRKKT